MIISDDDREFIRKNIPEALPFLDGDVDKVLRSIYIFIDIHGFAPPHYEDYNAIGRKAQAVYDHIYEDTVLQ